MTAQHDQKVIGFSSGTAEDDVIRINRMTGLAFQEKPESLLGRQEEWEAFAETLLGRAITFWDV